MARNFRDRDAEDLDLHAVVMQHSRPVYLHLLVNLLLLLVLVAGFAGGVLAVRYCLQQVEALLAIKPENRAQLLARDIERTQKKTEQAYSELAARIENPAIDNIRRQFSVMHKVTVEGEGDYARLLSAYRQVSYQLASRTRGSGEWYFYYEKEINKAIQQHQQLESQLDRYLAEKN